MKLSIEAREKRIAARAIRIKELERQLAEHDQRINATLADLRR